MNPTIKTGLQSLWAIFLIILLPIVFTGLTADPDLYLRLAGLSVFIIVLAFYLAVKNKKITWRPDSLITPLYLLFVLYTLFCITNSRNIAEGLFEWIKIMLGFLLLILLSGWMKTIKPEAAIVKSFTVLAFILSISGLFDLLRVIMHGPLVIPLNTYEVSSFYGHRNIYCQMLFFAFPFTMVASLYSKEKIFKLLGFTAYGLSLFLLIILSNRASWIALVAGFSALLFFYLLRKRKNFKLKNISLRSKILFLLTLLVLIVTFIVYRSCTNVGSLQTHAEGITNFSQGSAKDRIELWKRSIEMIKEKPVFGQGPGDWKIEVLKYGNTGLVSENNNTFYQRPHNDFLWILSEYGLVGFLLFAAFWIIAIIYLIRIIFASKSDEEFFYNNMLLFVILGFLVFSFFSFPRERAETTIVTSLILGLILNRHATLRSEKLPLPGQGRFFLFLVILLASAALFVIGARARSEIHVKKALLAKERNNYSLVIREINRAESVFYPMDPFSTPLTWYRGSAYFNQNKTDLALKDFEAAYLVNPYHVHVLNNLGSCYELKGAHDQSILYYKKSLTVAPNFEEAWFNLCAVYFNLGETDSAYLSLTHIDLHTKNPKFTQFMTVVLKKIFANAVMKDPSLQGVFELFNKNPEYYLKGYQYALVHNIEISIIFTDQSLLKTIASSNSTPL